jgi:hypothetical protein
MMHEDEHALDAGALATGASANRTASPRARGDRTRCGDGERGVGHCHRGTIANTLATAARRVERTETMTATKLANKRAAKAPAAKRRAVKARALKKGVSRETSTKGATPKPAATRRAAKRASGGAAQKEDRARAEEAAALWELCEEHTGRVRSALADDLLRDDRSRAPR